MTNALAERLKLEQHSSIHALIESGQKRVAGLKAVLDGKTRSSTTRTPSSRTYTSPLATLALSMRLALTKWQRKAKFSKTYTILQTDAHQLRDQLHDVDRNVSSTVARQDRQRDRRVTQFRVKYKMREDAQKYTTNGVHTSMNWRWKNSIECAVGGIACRMSVSILKHWMQNIRGYALSLPCSSSLIGTRYFRKLDITKSMVAFHHGLGMHLRG